MRYLRLVWVAYQGIVFCDDSPFAYIFSGASLLAATFACSGAGEKRAIRYFTYMQGHDWRESHEQSIHSWTTWCIHIALCSYMASHFKMLAWVLVGKTDLWHAR